ncbi:hypothetical protein LCGC14_0552020, partial [marine sediment metagenome]
MAVVPKVIPEVRPQAGPTVFQNVPTTGAEFGVRGAQQTQAFGKTLQAEGEKFFKQEEAKRKVAKKLQNRKEAVSRADILTQYNTDAEKLFRTTDSQEDFSREDTKVGFGVQLAELRKNSMASFQGSPEGRFILDERLAKAEGQFVGRSVEKSTSIEQAKVERVIGGHISDGVRVVSGNPSLLDAQITETLKLAQQDFGAFDPKQELAFNRVIPATLANAAISAYTIKGQFDKAKEVLTRPDISVALGPKRQQQLFDKIGTAEAAIVKATAEARNKDVKGIPRDIFNKLPEADQREIMELDEDEGRMLTPEETEAAGFDEGTLVFQKEGSAPKVVQKPGVDLAEEEARSRVKERGKLQARRSNVESILRAAGVASLAEGGAPIFAGEEGKGSASEDTRSVARLMQASRRLLAAGQTALANSLLSQARFVVENSPDIQLQKDLNKPVSRQLAAEMGVPAGTTLGEVA